MNETLVEIQQSAPGVSLITINRPERRNALNFEIKQLLADAIEALDRDTQVRVIVIVGAGSSFVAGSDVAEMQALTPIEHTLRATDRMFQAVRHCSKPVIAAVESYAFGGGCELALSCDIIIAGESAQFAQPEIRLGVMPGAGATQHMVRTIGKYQTLRLLLTGERIDARTAYALGLVSELSPDGSVLKRSLEVASTIAEMPALAVRAIKEVVHVGADAPIEAAMMLERRAFQVLFDSADQKEGMKAFLDKRTPGFQGR